MEAIMLKILKLSRPLIDERWRRQLARMKKIIGGKKYRHEFLVFISVMVRLTPTAPPHPPPLPAPQPPSLPSPSPPSLNLTTFPTLLQPSHHIDLPSVLPFPQLPHSPLISLILHTPAGGHRGSSIGAGAGRGGVGGC